MLAPGGIALVVSPLPEHLAALREAWGLLDVEPGKQERLAATFGAHLRLVEEVDVRYPVALGSGTLADLVAMGPNAFHDGAPRPGRGARPRWRSRCGSAPGGVGRTADVGRV